MKSDGSKDEAHQSGAYPYEESCIMYTVYVCTDDSNKNMTRTLNVSALFLFCFIFGILFNFRFGLIFTFVIYSAVCRLKRALGVCVLEVPCGAAIP